MISILISEGAIVHHTELPMPAILYGVIAMATFLALAAVTWSYRDVSNRNPKRSERAGH
ncbi:MAG: hypothetical protein RL537_779 [Actinomycetota bacterium]